ncbi:MAG: S8 family serine peptidase [Chloroflexi bacterium]|nr:S8 family serine peptidase [Chloroflexota bacterium]
MYSTNRKLILFISQVLLGGLLLTAVLNRATLAAELEQAAGANILYLPSVQISIPSSVILDEIIVKLDAQQAGATIAAINQTYNTTTVRPLSLGRAIYLLQTVPGADLDQLAQTMTADSRIVYAEPNRPTDAPESIGREAFSWGGPDDGPYNEQYAQEMLGLPAAHALSQGAGVIVAVIDTGVQLNHPHLASHLTAARIDFVDGDDVPEDEFSGGDDYGAGHGTHVAGIVRLTAPQAQIMPIRVLDTDGRGYSATVAEAILFALENGANVINLSLGMPYESPLLQDIIEDATEEGVVVVAAAGNLNSTQKQYPAATECVLSVTAVNPNRIKADFASYGDWLLLSAPGVGIYSTLPVDGYGSWSGTSMAAPFVAGQAALLLGLNAGLNVAQIADLMGGTAVDLNPFNPSYTNQLGVGLINVIASLNALQSGNIPILELLDEDCDDDDNDDGAAHNAGDYFMFAKASGDGGSSDPKVYEPVCDGANDKQADISGSNSDFYGRLHSNADLAISGSDNRFRNTLSPNSELTYGVNDGPSSACQLQAENSNTYASGYPLNITGNGNPGSIQGPYQIGPKGWPGNLGKFLDVSGMTFGNNIAQVLPGRVCDRGSLTHSGVIEITAADNGKVVCNGGDPIVISDSGLGTPVNPFRVTMVSHGLIEISGSNHYLAPAAYSVLAWTDQRFSNEATSIKIAGSNVNVIERAILFSPRSGQDVSGSNNALLCIQMVGQGALKAAGSNSVLGPFAPGC